MDKWKGTGQFHPDAAWKKIQQDNMDRELERKTPLKWWEPLFFTVWGWVTILGVLGAAAFLLLWLLSAPLAR